MNFKEDNEVQTIDLVIDFSAKGVGKVVNSVET